MSMGVRREGVGGGSRVVVVVVDGIVWLRRQGLAMGREAVR